MKRSIVVGLALSIALASSGAFALNEKTNSPYDFRIKSVVYNPLDVVELDAVAGVSTHIQMAPDETYVTHVFGESGGWVLTSNENNIFVRPVAELSDTNLTIISNKRTYYLVLHCISYAEKKQPDGTVKQEFIKTPWQAKQATVGLIYKYPFEDMALANRKLEERRVQEALNKADTTGPRNIDYQMSDEPGTEYIRPTWVWDNYRSTSFEFPANAELPTIFVVGSDGKESVANVTPMGENSNILVVPQTAKMWKVRMGDKVVGVVNGNYNPSLGANPSNTVTPEVKRVLKPAKEDN